MLEKTKEKLDQEAVGWQAAAGKLSTLWCDFMHDSPMWPIHGQCQCRTCGRYHPVLWAGDRLLLASAELIVAAPARRVQVPYRTRNHSRHAPNSPSAATPGDHRSYLRSGEL